VDLHLHRVHFLVIDLLLMIEAQGGQCIYHGFSNSSALDMTAGCCYGSITTSITLTLVVSDPGTLKTTIATRTRAASGQLTVCFQRFVGSDCSTVCSRDGQEPGLTKTNRTRTQVLPRTRQNSNPNVTVLTGFFH